MTYHSTYGMHSSHFSLVFILLSCRPEKVKHFTVIPGHIKVSLRLLRPDETVDSECSLFYLIVSMSSFRIVMLFSFLQLAAEAWLCIVKSALTFYWSAVFT